MKDRLPPFNAATATAPQKAVLEQILSGPHGKLEGPFLGWLHSPEFALHAQQLGVFCRYRTGLPLRLSELAILITAAHWQCQAAWHIHHPIAVQAGVPAHTLEAIRSSRTPGFDAPDDALIHAFATALLATRRVAQALYERVLERFGAQVTVELVGLLGCYSMVAMSLNAFEMRAHGQHTLPFAQN
jgi:4-carboxymuconolactone decarboxylase